MQKFATSMIAKPVLLKAERALVGVVSDIVIDYSTGKMLGIMVREGFGKKHLKTIAEKDIEGIGQNFFLVKSYSVLGDPEEIVRIKKILDKNINILKNKVVTLSGQTLGRVYDFTIDVATGYLTKIYVRPYGIFSFSTDHIIDFSQIISIEVDKITVEDSTIQSKAVIPADIPEAS